MRKTYRKTCRKTYSKKAKSKQTFGSRLKTVAYILWVVFVSEH